MTPTEAMTGGGLDAVRAAVLAAEPADFPAAPPPPEEHDDADERTAFDGGGAWDRGPGDPDLDRALADELRNDVGNAQRLIKRFGGDLLFVRDVGWFAWTGTHWSLSDGERKARLFAHRTAVAIFGEARAMEEGGPPKGRDPLEGEGKDAWEARLKDWDDRIAGHRRWANTSGMAARLVAMVEHAAPYLTRSVDELDAHPFLFSCANFTLELGAPVEGLVRAREHRREDLLTHCAAVTYDPDAACPTWRRFLDSIQPEADTRLFLQRWCGYSMTGDTRHSMVLLMHGHGANGKSTFYEAVMAILGPYALTLPFSSLLRDDKKRGSEATPDLADLPGKRMAVAAEPENGAVMSESTIKLLAGSAKDRMRVRFLNQNFFSFRPAHKLWLSFNQKPRVSGADHGTWRRMALVFFPVIFIDPHEREGENDPRPMKDETLPDTLLAEQAGVLNWMLDGFRLWWEAGPSLMVPKTVRDATQEYREENDPIGMFLQVATRKMPGGVVGATTLYQSYIGWCKKNGIGPVSATLFGRIVKERGVKWEKSGVIVYRDIAINEGFIFDEAAAPGSGHGPHDD